MKHVYCIFIFRVKELDADDENDRKKIDANQFGDNFDNKSTDLELIESLCVSLLFVNIKLLKS